MAVHDNRQILRNDRENKLIKEAFLNDGKALWSICRAEIKALVNGKATVLFPKTNGLRVRGVLSRSNARPTIKRGIW